MEKDKLHISDYARTSIAEDVAETLAFYVSIKGLPYERELRDLIQERMKVVDALQASLQ